MKALSIQRHNLPVAEASCGDFIGIRLSEGPLDIQRGEYESMNEVFFVLFLFLSVCANSIARRKVTNVIVMLLVRIVSLNLAQHFDIGT